MWERYGDTMSFHYLQPVCALALRVTALAAAFQPGPSKAAAGEAKLATESDVGGSGGAGTGLGTDPPAQAAAAAVGGAPLRATTPTAVLQTLHPGCGDDTAQCRLDERWSWSVDMVLGMLEAGQLVASHADPGAQCRQTPVRLPSDSWRCPSCAVLMRLHWPLASSRTHAPPFPLPGSACSSGSICDIIQLRLFRLPVGVHVSTWSVFSICTLGVAASPTLHAALL